MSKSRDLRLHHQYGANPTIPLCIFCGKEKGEVAMLGAAYKGEAPKHMVIDQDPCDPCKEKMAQGITIIESRQDEDGRPHYTGRYVVLKEEAIEKIFQPKSTVDSVLAYRKALMDEAAFTALFATKEIQS